MWWIKIIIIADCISEYKLKVMQSLPSVCPSIDVRLFPLKLLNGVIFDLDLLHVYEPWPCLKVKVKGQNAVGMGPQAREILVTDLFTLAIISRRSWTHEPKLVAEKNNQNRHGKRSWWDIFYVLNNFCRLQWFVVKWLFSQPPLHVMTKHGGHGHEIQIQWYKTKNYDKKLSENELH